MQQLYVSSSQLRKGDVVLTHGMRVLIDQDIQNYAGAHGRVYHVNGLVTNIEEVLAENFIPKSWLYPDVFRGGWTKDWDADPRWAIQGNDHAHWVIERD